MRGTWQAKHRGKGRAWAKNIPAKYWGWKGAKPTYEDAVIPACPVRKICIICTKAEQVSNKRCGGCSLQTQTAVQEGDK